MTTPKNATGRPRSARANKAVEKVEAPVVEEVVDLEVEDDDFEDEDEGPITTIDPRDIQKYKDAILYVRNNTNMLIVWAPNFGKGEADTLRLSQAGTPESISELPWDVATHRGFLRFWRQGKVTVTDDPRIEENLAALAQADVEYERLQQTSVDHSLDRQHNRTIAWPGIAGSPENIAAGE